MILNLLYLEDVKGKLTEMWIFKKMLKIHLIDNTNCKMFSSCLRNLKDLHCSPRQSKLFKIHVFQIQKWMFDPYIFNEIYFTTLKSDQSMFL